MEELKARTLLALSINKIKYNVNDYTIDCHTNLPSPILSTIIGKRGIGDVVAGIHKHNNTQRIIIHRDRTNDINKDNYVRNAEYSNGEYHCIGSGPNYHAKSWIIEASIVLGINMTCLKQVDDNKYQIHNTNWTLDELLALHSQYHFEQVDGKLYISV